MIFVDRSRIEEPDVLRSERALNEKQRLVDLLSSATADHLSQLRITFEPSIWTQVKPHLLELFSSKCAYCEQRLTGLSGGIEHYRPRNNADKRHLRWPSSSEQRWSMPSQRHLYYSWLAYDWDNLLLICADCNLFLGRESSFPVVGARANFLAGIDECRRTERPLLLDPCFDQPSEHLRCNKKGLLEALTEQGEFTLEILGLNARKDLINGRKIAWDEVTKETEYVLSSRQFSGMHDQQMLYRVLSNDLPYQLARRSAFANRAEDMRSRNIFIEGISELLGNGSMENVTRLSTFAKSGLVHIRQGGFRGKKMIPEHSHQNIRRIGIRNFKAIEEIDIEIPETPQTTDRIRGALALLGENATGKSSILEAVALAILGTEQIERLGVDGLRCLRRSHSQGAEISARYPAEIVLTLDQGDDVRLSIDLDGRFFGNQQRAFILLGYGPRRFFSQRRNVRRFQEPWHRVKSMFDPLARLPDPTPWLLSCTKKEFNLVVRALRTMMLLPDEALVVRGEPTGGSGAPTVFFELNGRHESLETLSEGYKTVVAMGVDIMRELLEYWPDLEEARGIVLIDELDTHLHPRWKMRIAQRLRQSLPNVQFLTSTHDPLCLRGYFDKEVQVLRRTPMGSVERVVDLPRVQGLSVQQLLTSDYFGLYSTEDPGLDESVVRYSTLLSKAERTPSEELELARQRAELGENLLLGAKPADRIVQDAIREYLLKRQNVLSDQVAQLHRDAVAEVVEFWDSIDLQDSQNLDKDS